MKTLNMAAPTQSTAADISVSVEQEVFTQRKLKDLYQKTCERLRLYRNWIEFVQEVLVWRKPAASLTLYAVIHWVFVYFVRWNDSLLTQLASLLFWVLLGDVFWRAATRDGKSEGERREGRTQTRRRFILREMSFDTILVQASAPLGAEQLVPFELICLRVARGLMWGDNLWLALRYWSTNEPLTFGVVIAIPGVVLSLLGKYVPTVVLAYVTVMGLVVWPYIEYHNLRHKAMQYALTHFPGVLEKAKAAWTFLKTVAVSRVDVDNPEFSLMIGDSEDTTQQTLQHAFDQATAQPQQGGGKEEGGGGDGGRGGGGDGGRGGGGDGGRGGGGDDGRGGGGRGHDGGHGGGGAVRDPGLSLLQDSVLGLHPNAFHDSELDSLSTSYLGPGEFPSITTFDQSAYTLPPQETNQPMPTILEEEGPQDDLDPFLDSMEVEFGFPNSRTTHGTTARSNPYGLSTSAPTSSSTFDPYAPSAPPLMGDSGHHIPPPRYEDVVSNSGSAQLPYSSSLGFETQYALPPRRTPMHEQATSDMMPRSSSTPLVEGTPTGPRYRDVQKRHTNQHT